MDNQELMRHWLWMQTMEYALKTMKWKVKNWLYPPDKEHEWRRTGWEEMQRVIFTYILEHWDTPEHEGLYSGFERFSIGCDLTADSSGVTGKYKDIKVLITWPEVRKFIKTMLAGEPDKQLDLFELLTREAMR